MLYQTSKSETASLLTQPSTEPLVNGFIKVKRISWTIAAALIAGLFLPVSAAHATEPITNESQLLAIQNNLEGSYTLLLSMRMQQRFSREKTVLRQSLPVIQNSRLEGFGDENFKG